jgi:hypothetical protein
MRTKNRKLNAMMPLIVNGAVKTIMEENAIDEMDAIKNFYNSETYLALEDERSGFWKMSDLLLADIFNSEKTNETLLREVLL